MSHFVIPDKVDNIGNRAFYGCSNLEELSLPNNVSYIGSAAFSYCSKLKSISIPNGVSTLSDYTFEGCANLSSIILPNGLSSIGVCALSDCANLLEVVIPHKVETIGDGAFARNKVLKTIEIPASVRTIGNNAFYGCTEIRTVKLGEGCQSIGKSAFGSCQNLTDFYSNAINVPNTNVDAFKDSYVEYASLHVPDVSITRYQGVEPWKNFGTIVSITSGNEREKCAAPSVAYENGKLTFTCETDGAECVTMISDTDIKTHYGNEIELTATYTINVYATATGYEDSDVITATLCWINSDPKTEGMANNIAHAKGQPVIIQVQRNLISFTGVDAGTDILVYDMSGKLRGKGKSMISSMQVNVNTDMQAGEIAVVNIGGNCIKILMK